jgi:KaiC/GvpD/RAD55 family RecA-like ATPase
VRTTIGVDGIDALIEGGVPIGASVLVAGEAGTGKTVLCIQFVLAGIREGEPGVYVTADPPGRVLEEASSLGWDLRGAVEDGYARIVQVGAPPPPPEPAEGEGEGEGGESRDGPGGPPRGGFGGPPGGGFPGGGPSGGPPGGGPPGGPPMGGGMPFGGEASAGGADREQTLDAEVAADAIAEAVAEIRAERVVIDRPVPPGSVKPSDAAEFIAHLVRSTLERTHCTTLVAGQRLRGGVGYTTLGIEEQVVDGIIDMGVVEEAGRRRRVLSVHAMHGTSANLDDHPFAIVRGRGIVVGDG